MNAVIDLTRAFAFAATRHARQRRKGEADDPYVNHLAEVASMLAKATGGEDPALVIAGLLHDVVEDGYATEQEVTAAFGPDVAHMVMEVTDPPDLPNTERKQHQVETAPCKSVRARMIKLADKTSNLREILRDPPRDWSAERKRDYFEWARRLADGCRGVNPQLEAWFDEVYESRKRLGL